MEEIKEINIKIDPATLYWVVSINQREVMKSKTLEKLARSLYKWTKSQSL